MTPNGYIVSSVPDGYEVRQLVADPYPRWKLVAEFETSDEAEREIRRLLTGKPSFECPICLTDHDDPFCDGCGRDLSHENKEPLVASVHPGSSDEGQEV